MKITKEDLQQIIKEELENVLSEQEQVDENVDVAEFSNALRALFSGKLGQPDGRDKLQRPSYQKLKLNDDTVNRMVKAAAGSRHLQKNVSEQMSPDDIVQRTKTDTGKLRRSPEGPGHPNKRVLLRDFVRTVMRTDLSRLLTPMGIKILDKKRFAIDVAQAMINSPQLEFMKN